MSGHRARRDRGVWILAAVGAAAIVSTTPSCKRIEAQPLTNAPLNTCPCDGYEPSQTTTAVAFCSGRSRCELATTSARPDFPFWIVVNVPDTSFAGSGLAYVLYSGAQGSPAFQDSTPIGVVKTCRPPLCLSVGAVADTRASYRVLQGASATVGYPLGERTPLPMSAVYEPTGNEQQDTFPLLPLDLAFASPRLEAGGEIVTVRALPPGRYRRVFYPQPPLDEFFPPTSDDLVVTAPGIVDDFLLGEAQLDEVRTAKVSREEGLDGWRVWLVERPSGRRISVIRTLPAEAEAEVRLYTSNASAAFAEDRVDAIVAPPASWTAVPRFVTPLFNGGGLGNLSYPRIPPPVSVRGVVAEPRDGSLLYGYPATVSFESASLATSSDPSTLLHYSATVSTDDRGRFATVLPPGTYAATVEPLEGTGHAKTREVVVVDRAVTAVTFRPPPRTIVRGRAVLTDGRPASEADVVAIADIDATTTNPLAIQPRPARGRTDDDGRFVLEADPGPYVLSVVPKEGTGFPRVVVRHSVPSSTATREIELADVRVPPPMSLSLTFRDSSPTENAIQSAVVRVFAVPLASQRGVPVEIGSAMTNELGKVEILLAQQPR